MRVQDQTRHTYALKNGEFLTGTMTDFTSDSNTIRTEQGRQIVIPWTAVLYREDLDA